jgi:N,N-dimethylformamidase
VRKTSGAPACPGAGAASIEFTLTTPGQGFDRGSAYRKTTAASSLRWSWIFSGVESESFGGGSALVLGHAAAGFEIDRVDAEAGTPEHTIVLASADGFTDAYQTAIERTTAIAP